MSPLSTVAKGCPVGQESATINPLYGVALSTLLLVLVLVIVLE